MALVPKLPRSPVVPLRDRLMNKGLQICVLGGDGGGNSVHYLQSTLTVRIPASRSIFKTAALDGEIGQGWSPRPRPLNWRIT